MFTHINLEERYSDLLVENMCFITFLSAPVSFKLLQEV